MRRFVLAAVLATAACAGPVPSPGTAIPPNFVIFIADDQGYGDLGCYGHPFLKTPNIDRLAQDGVKFDRAFLTISSCSPSRASILTGRYPHNTGAEDLHQPLPEDQKTLAFYLRGAGYHTMAAGKWHLGPHEKKKWHRQAECPASELGDLGVRLLADRPKDRPFLLWVASMDPHRPFNEPMPKPHDPAKVVVPPYLPDHPLIRKEIAQYYDEIERFDRHVGQVMAELERQQLLDDTYVFYLSDNGMPFPRAKTTLYDSGIRTPLIIRGGPFTGGLTRSGLVSSVDIAPTILDLARVEEDSMQGRSLQALPGSDGPGWTEVFAEANWHDYDQFSRAVRTRDRLLVRNYYFDKPLWNSVDSINSQTWKGFMEMEKAGKLTPAQRFLFIEPRPQEEFYDLEKDPHSLKNVIDDPAYRDEVARYRKLLDGWREYTSDVIPKERVPDGWTRDGIPLPHNQPWYDRYLKEGKSTFEKF